MRRVTKFVLTCSIILVGGLAAVPFIEPKVGPPRGPAEPDWRSLFPGSDPEVARQINARFNLQMDLMENVEGADRAQIIQSLRDTALDDANDEQLRRWTLAIIGTLISEADLAAAELRPLAQTFLDVAYQSELPATPMLRAAARANMIGTELYVFPEFMEAIEAVENDIEVMAYYLEMGLGEVWIQSTSRGVANIRANEAPGSAAAITPRQVVRTAEFEALEWRYTLEKPSDDAHWTKSAFDDSKWLTGKAGFGTATTPSSKVGTEWTAESIWLRHHFKIDSLPEHPLRLRFHHNDDAEVFINGVRVVELKGRTKWYKEVEFPKEAREALVKGENVLAVTCRNLGGPQYIDVGIIEVVPAPKDEAKEAEKQAESPTRTSPDAPKGK